MKSKRKFFVKIIKIIVRDCRQITFVTLNRFCPLSEPPLFLMDNGKMDRIPTKIKWKIHTFFTLLHFKFWRYFLWKFVRYSHQIFLFLLAGITFLRFLELLSTISGKSIFVTNVPFLTDLLRPSTPLMTKSGKRGKSFLLMLPKGKYWSDCIVLWLKDFFWPKDKTSNLFFN